VIIVHPNKAGANDPLMRTNGARAFSQAVRSIIVLGRDPNDPENTSHRFPPHAKGSVGAKHETVEYRLEPTLIPAADGDPEVTTARLVEIGASNLTSRDMFTHADPDERTQTDDAVDFLHEILAAARTGRRPHRRPRPPDGTQRRVPDLSGLRRMGQRDGRERRPTPLDMDRNYNRA